MHQTLLQNLAAPSPRQGSLLSHDQLSPEVEQPEAVGNSYRTAPNTFDAVFSNEDTILAPKPVQENSPDSDGDVIETTVEPSDDDSATIGASEDDNIILPQLDEHNSSENTRNDQVVEEFAPDYRDTYLTDDGKSNKLDATPSINAPHRKDRTAQAAPSGFAKARLRVEGIPIRRVEPFSTESAIRLSAIVSPDVAKQTAIRPQNSWGKPVTRVMDFPKSPDSNSTVKRTDITVTGQPTGTSLVTEKMAALSVTIPESGQEPFAAPPPAQSRRREHNPAPIHTYAKTTTAGLPVHSELIKPVQQMITASAQNVQHATSSEFQLFSLEAAIQHSWETPSLQSASQTAQPARAALPAQIAVQMAEVVRQMPTRPVEITLSPEELGRVRLSVSTSDTGIIVNVVAERPETLDLMRRHIDQLGQEFHAIGYKNIAFSFAGGEQPPTDQQRDGDAPKAAIQSSDIESVEPEKQIHLSTGSLTGLDLRL